MGRKPTKPREIAGVSDGKGRMVPRPAAKRGRPRKVTPEGARRLRSADYREGFHLFRPCQGKALGLARVRAAREWVLCDGVLGGKKLAERELAERMYLTPGGDMVHRVIADACRELLKEYGLWEEGRPAGDTLTLEDRQFVQLIVGQNNMRELAAGLRMVREANEKMLDEVESLSREELAAALDRAQWISKQSRDTEVHRQRCGVLLLEHQRKVRKDQTAEPEPTSFRVVIADDGYDDVEE